MSDDWITLVPRETGHVPQPDQQQAGLALFRQIAPDADEITVINQKTIRFFDCGANFECVRCPRCTEEITEWWGQCMDSDFSKETGFSLNAYTLPCCGEAESLDRLVYQWPQAFGRFRLSARNPNLGLLPVDSLRQIEAGIGCALVVVYQHL